MSQAAAVEHAVKFGQSRRRRAPAPGSQAHYLSKAEACLHLAASASDSEARALHEEECKLWLMLAHQRQAIEDVLQRYVADAA